MPRVATYPSTSRRLTILGAIVVVALVGCSGGAERKAAAPPEAASTGPTADAASAVVTDAHGTRVTLVVTENGFEPATVVVPAGKPVTLSVTRRYDFTCATELVMKEHDINLKLPLNETAEVTFTPARAETLGYACAMDHVRGTIVVK